MIRYSLSCSNAHSFESWFKSAAAFDDLKSAGMVACPVCSDSHIEKSLMAPQVRPARKVATPPAKTEPMAAGQPADMETAIKAIREHVEANSDYVGDRFAEEARSMHLGEVPERSIYGEVPRDEAKKLIDDGVPALPLPFVPKQKTN